MSQRIFDGMFSRAGFDFFPNHLHGAGAKIPMHAHPYDHVALFYPGDSGDTAVYRVTAIYKSGERRELEVGAWNMLLIEAGVEHEIELWRGNYGSFVCLNAMYDENGKRADVHGHAEPRTEHM